MGRRGLHNEGAEILREQLEGKVEIDFYGGGAENRPRPMPD